MRFQLSQSSLTLLTTCPRKFQHIVLDQISTPTPPEQQARMDWGDRFHRLMQQHELGLISPRSTVDSEEQVLRNCVQALTQASPDLFKPATMRQSEHQRTLDWHGVGITAIYDLLILNPDQAHIIDWKTYARPQKAQGLEHHWQTRLYPFVLAETTDYEPEQIAMTYWFVQPQQTPEFLSFSYNGDRHQQTRHELTEQVQQLKQWLQEYDELDQDFPQVDPQQGICEACSFVVRCQRQQKNPVMLSIDEIPEVMLNP